MSQAQAALSSDITESLLNLFYFEEGDNYSNFFHLYNEIPKYVFDAAKDQKNLDSIHRKFTVDKKEYTVTLHPARIKIKNNAHKISTVELFLGTREELVEDAIVKIAIENKSLYKIGSETRIEFVLHHIYDALNKAGQAYSGAQIREALSVLRGASLIVEGEGNRWEFSSFPYLT